MLLFLLYGTVTPPSNDGNQIIVSQSGIATLANQFQATWSRPPTPVEWQGLVDGYVRDEILFRVGVEIGQVFFIVAVLAVHKALAKLLARRFDLARLAPVQAYAIGGLASYWLFERVSGFWS